MSTVSRTRIFVIFTRILVVFVPFVSQVIIAPLFLIAIHKIYIVFIVVSCSLTVLNAAAFPILIEIL
jgi:hypothetical protein